MLLSFVRKQESKPRTPDQVRDDRLYSRRSDRNFGNCYMFLATHVPLLQFRSILLYRSRPYHFLDGDLQLGSTVNFLEGSTSAAPARKLRPTIMAYLNRLLSTRVTCTSR